MLNVHLSVTILFLVLEARGLFNRHYHVGACKGQRHCWVVVGVLWQGLLPFRTSEMKPQAMKLTMSQK